MNYRQLKAMRFAKLSWITKIPWSCPHALVFYLINAPIPKKFRLLACISSRITTVIQVVRYYQINYNWFNEPFAVSLYKCLYLDMHGLIFKTSIWLLAGSTRLLHLRGTPCNGKSLLQIAKHCWLYADLSLRRESLIQAIWFTICISWNTFSDRVIAAEQLRTSGKSYP